MAAVATPVLSEQEQVAKSLESKPIPKPNLDPDAKVEEVYPFSTLIPPAVAHTLSIKEWQDKVGNDEEVVFKHRFPAFRLSVIGKAGDTRRLQALRYLTLLLEFHDALSSNGRNGKKVPKKDVLQKSMEGWPDALVDGVRRRFATPANEFPKWNLDNLYTHMCALSLYVDAWTTDTSNLRDDLKMENKEMALYFKELGCRIAGPTDRERETLNAWLGQKGMTKSVAATTRVAKLRVPPEFPKVRRARAPGR